MTYRYQISAQDTGKLAPLIKNLMLDIEIDDAGIMRLFIEDSKIKLEFHPVEQ